MIIVENKLMIHFHTIKIFVYFDNYMHWNKYEREDISVDINNFYNNYCLECSGTFIKTTKHPLPQINPTTGLFISSEEQTEMSLDVWSLTSFL